MPPSECRGRSGRIQERETFPVRHRRALQNSVRLIARPSPPALTRVKHGDCNSSGETLQSASGVVFSPHVAGNSLGNATNRQFRSMTNIAYGKHNPHGGAATRRRRIDQRTESHHGIKPVHFCRPSAPLGVSRNSIRVMPRADSAIFL